MKALIFSDSHGSFTPMMEAIEREKNISTVIHAGDVLRDVEDLKAAYPNYNIIYVVGNNDFWHSDEPEERFFALGGVKIFLTHGHKYSVKYSTAALWRRAKELGAQVAVFGHTHMRLCEQQGGIWLFNPGSARSSYGVLEAENGQVKLSIYEV